MHKTFTTITSLSEGYPFPSTSFSLPNFESYTQIRLPYGDRSAKEHLVKLNKILQLQTLSSSLIKLTHVLHDTTKNHFLLTYESLPYPLTDIFDLKIQPHKIEPKIHAICQFLLQKKILPIYQPNRFGFTHNKQLKYFLEPNFVQITTDHQLNQHYDQLQLRIKTLCKSLKPTSSISPRETIQDDKTSLRVSERDLSAINKKFQQKISQIQNKLLLSRQVHGDKLSNSQKLKKRKKFSHNFTQENVSISSSSSNSVKKFENKKTKEFQTEKRSSIRNQYETKNMRTSPQRYYIKSTAPLGKKNSSEEEVQSPQTVSKEKTPKLTNSLIIQEKNQVMEKLKHHKSSFGDYSNYGNESEKEMKLKRRISFALQKSQNALKIYEKYQSMRNSQPHPLNQPLKK